MQSITRVFAALLILTIGMAGSVLAHAPVTSSSIEDGAVLANAPENFTITFGGKVGLASLTLKNSAGETVNEGQKLPRSMQASFDVPFPALTPDSYIIEWRSMSSDGHIMSGKISFTIK